MIRKKKNRQSTALEGFSPPEDIETPEFLFHLAALVFNLPHVAAFARHKWPRNTLRDYIRPGATYTPEARVATAYLRDVMMLPTDQILAKWFRGRSRMNAATKVAKRLAESNFH